MSSTLRLERVCCFVNRPLLDVPNSQSLAEGRKRNDRFQINCKSVQIIFVDRVIAEGTSRVSRSNRLGTVLRRTGQFFRTPTHHLADVQRCILLTLDTISRENTYEEIESNRNNLHRSVYRMCSMWRRLWDTSDPSRHCRNIYHPAPKLLMWRNCRRMNFSLSRLDTLFAFAHMSLFDVLQ